VDSSCLFVLSLYFFEKALIKVFTEQRRHYSTLLGPEKLLIKGSLIDQGDIDQEIIDQGIIRAWPIHARCESVHALLGITALDGTGWYVQVVGWRL
jgi:hypothetical protein